MFVPKLYRYTPEVIHWPFAEYHGWYDWKYLPCLAVNLSTPLKLILASAIGAKTSVFCSPGSPVYWPCVVILGISAHNKHCTGWLKGSVII
ncbi:hypothetical protein ATCV1_z666L [Acanthocystis turfacea chlorella virus 1]|uniref:Uncharacterized protein z666L n=1 Tax=Chlorovirus heliozoae TaxID=322019 RepID=A7K9S6_9PHYC|nr:hypothetical protein ATCV1_z666L [Acanthocystis turfacea chlorella virus 1]ABT16800.1 hypothetical protein ATCV1_z666L [Acanthocystis turfacea chlorella virus 1]